MYTDKNKNPSILPRYCRWGHIILCLHCYFLITRAALYDYDNTVFILLLHRFSVRTDIRFVL